MAEETTSIQDTEHFHQGLINLAQPAGKKLKNVAEAVSQPPSEKEKIKGDKRSTKGVTSATFGFEPATSLSGWQRKDKESTTPIESTAYPLQDTELLQQQAEADVAQQLIPPPMISMEELLNSHASIDQLPNVPEYFSRQVTDQSLSNARAAYNLSKSGGDVTTNMLDDYKFVEQAYKNAKEIVDESVPEYPIAWIDPITGKVSTKASRKYFKIFPNSQKRYAENRKNLLTLSINIGLGNRPQVVNTLLDHFTTGDMQIELGNRMRDFVTGSTTLLNLAWGATADMANAFYHSFDDENPEMSFIGNALDKFSDRKGERKRNHELFMDSLDAEGVLADHTLMMNELIQERYIEDRMKDKGQTREEVEKYIKDKRINLTLTPKEARTLLDFSYSESGYLKTLAMFGIENFGLQVGLTSAVRGIAAPFSFAARSISKGKFDPFPSNIAAYENATVLQKTARNSDGTLKYANMAISEVMIMHNKHIQWRRNWLGKTLDFATFGWFRRIGTREKAAQGMLKQRSLSTENHTIISRQRDSLQRSIDKLNELHDNPNTVWTGKGATKKRTVDSGGWKLQVDKAQEVVDKKLNDLIMLEVKSVRGISLIPTSQYMRSSYIDEVAPTLMQTNVYEWMTWGGAAENPEVLDTAELFAMAGYMASALGIPGAVAQYTGAKFLGKKIPIAKDISFGVNMTLRWIGLPNNIDEAIITASDGTMTMLDPITGTRVPITAETYRRIKYHKDTLLLLPEEDLNRIVASGKKLNAQIESMVKDIANPVLRQELADNLRVGFAEMSGITYFQALARKTATNLDINDIMNVTSRFRQSLIYADEAGKQLETASRLMQEIQQKIARSADQGMMNPATQMRVSSFMDMRANLLAGAEKMQMEMAESLKSQYEDLRHLLKNKIVIEATPDELQKQLEMLNNARNSPILRGDKGPSVIPEDPALAKAFFDLPEVKEAFQNIATFHGDAMDTLAAQTNKDVNLRKIQGAGKIAMNNPDEFKKLEAITLKQANIFNNSLAQKLDTIYKPLAQLPKVNSSSLFKSLITRNKDTQVFDATTHDKRLTQFLPTSTFAQTSAGARIITAMDQAAAESLNGVFPPGMYADMVEPDGALADIIRPLIKEKYGLMKSEAKGNINIQMYDYLSEPANQDSLIAMIKKEVTDGGGEWDEAAINFDNMDEVKLSFETLEYIRRLARDNKNKFINRDTGLPPSDIATQQKYEGWKDLEELFDNHIIDAGADITWRGKKVSDLIPEIRLEARTNVYKRIRKGTKNTDDTLAWMLRQHLYEKQKAGITPAANFLIHTKFGEKFVKGLYSKDQSTKEKAVRDFRELLTNAFGVRMYPNDPRFVDEFGNLKPGINFKEQITAPDGQKMSVSEYLYQSSTFKFDPNKKDGRTGIKFAKAFITTLLKENKVYEKVIEGERILLKSKDIYDIHTIKYPLGADKRTSTNSFLTDPHGEERAYAEWQQILTDEHGVVLVDLDDLVKAEMDIFKLIQKNKEMAVQVETEVAKINKMAQGLESKVRTNNKIQATLDSYWDSAFDGDMVGLFYDSIPRGLQGDAKITGEAIIKLDQMKKRLLEFNPKITEKEIDAYLASRLIDSIMDKGKYTTKTDNTGVEAATRADNLGNPEISLAYMEQDKTKQMLKTLGVDSDHYDGILATVGYLTLVKGFKDSASAVNPQLPATRYTDAGIMARAFNYARGMVSAEYILVEAGFRIMRDNDIEIINWLLNDKGAAEFMLRIIEDSKKGEYITTNDAKTFYNRMRAYIARVLAEKGQRIDSSWMGTPPEEEEN